MLTYIIWNITSFQKHTTCLFNQKRIRTKKIILIELNNSKYNNSKFDSCDNSWLKICKFLLKTILYLK